MFNMKFLLLSIGLMQMVLGGPVRKDGPVPNTPENSNQLKIKQNSQRSFVLNQSNLLQLQSLSLEITNKISKSLAVNSKAIWY